LKLPLTGAGIQAATTAINAERQRFYAKPSE
jgi:hypothetical protein